MSIIVLGTVALDTVRTPFGIRRHILGGSAVHFAMSARLFTQVNLVAIVGEDFPQRYIEFLHKKGIILTSLIRSEGKTFRWRGEYRGDLNSALTLSTELGVLSTFKPTVSREQRKIKNIFLQKKYISNIEEIFYVTKRIMIELNVDAKKEVLILDV